MTDAKVIEKGDVSFWARRDLQASHWLEKLYDKWKLPYNFGTRKYSFIPSGRNGPQVFASCFFVAFLLQLGLRARVQPREDEAAAVQVKWHYSPLGECTNDVCRPCYQKWIVPEPATAGRAKRNYGLMPRAGSGRAFSGTR